MTHGGPDHPSGHASALGLGEHGPRFITQQDRIDAARLLNPRMFNEEILSYILDYVMINMGKIPAGLIEGFTLPVWSFDEEGIGVDHTTTSTTYADLNSTDATSGPSLTGLGNGTYVVTFGFAGFNATADQYIYMSVSVNGAAASDNDACFSEGAGANRDNSHMRSVKKVLTSGNNNSLVCQYRVTGVSTGHAYNRWLMAQRIGDA